MIDSQRVTWTVLAMFLNGSSVLEKQLYVPFVDKSLITSTYVYVKSSDVSFISPLSELAQPIRQGR